MDISKLSSRLWMICATVAAGLMLTTLPSLAQDANQDGYSLQDSQQQDSQQQDNSTDNKIENKDASTENTDQSNAGPVRMARFAYLSGEVTWRGADTMDWASAKTNLPLKQGAQITVANGGRAEIQFDDGSYLRLGAGAVATLVTLYSDTQGEFTEIKLTNGLAMLRLTNDHSVYQVDTPLVSVKASGPARVRFGLNEGVELSVSDGKALVEGAQGKVNLKAGDYLDLRDDKSPYDVRAVPSPDSWERWNDDRDRTLDEAAASAIRHDVPDNISMVAGDLDSYGTWTEDPDYGYVWCPRVVTLGWRPYCDGSWVWVNPFGWTWCSSEPWGWAPYHYGTWFHARYGWAWRPGPAHQYWCPAVVHFSAYHGDIAWCPLAPAEVRYPAALKIGFRGGDWAAFFSIGVAGCYYPGHSRADFFVGHAWNNVYVNHVTYVDPANRFHGAADFVTNHNTYLDSRNYVPINARSVGGATIASESAFAGKEGYRPLPAGVTMAFTQGHAIAAPAVGQAPVAGPQSIRPTVSALTPNRTFVRSADATPSVNNQPVYRARVSPEIARTSSPFSSGSAGNANVHSTTPGSVATGSQSLSQTGRPGAGANASTSGSSRATSAGTVAGGSPGATPSGTAHNAAAEAATRARASIGWTGGHSGADNGSSGSGMRSDGTSSTGSSSSNRTGGYGSSRSYGGSESSGRSYGYGSSSGSTYGSNGSRSYDGSSAGSRSYGSGAGSGASTWHSYEGSSSSGRTYSGGSSSGGGSATGGSRSNGGGPATGGSRSSGGAAPSSGGGTSHGTGR